MRNYAHHAHIQPHARQIWDGAVLLTTDDDLVKIMKKNALRTSIRADNPLHWLMEVNHHGE